MALAGGTLLLAIALPAGAATAPSLGTAEPFAVLAGTTVTNTGATTIIGDLGVSSGSTISDSGAITLTGATHAGDAVALQAQNDVTTAFDALTTEPCDQSFVGTAVEIGGQTLTPGAYCYSSSAQLTGALTLNGDGVYIFKMGSTLTTASGSSIVFTGGAEACNVFWQVGSSADLFSATAFAGNILALTSINMQAGATLDGRALARNGAVTLDSNVITNSVCALADTPTPTDTPTLTATPTNTLTPTNTPANSATATNTPGSNRSNPATRTPVDSSTGSTPTVQTGPPPASEIEQPALQGTPASDDSSVNLPNAGGGPGSGDGFHGLVVLVAAAFGAVALGVGTRRRHADASTGRG